MKAIRFHEFGGPEVLKYEDAPDPQLRKDQVLVRVKACAMNHLDLWVRKGLPGVNLPHINGSDISGDIAELGEYITDLKMGQRVLLAPMSYCGSCQMCMEGKHSLCRQFTVLGNGVDGGNCEYIAVTRDKVFPIPDDLTYDEAASVPLVFLTAWHMLVGRAQLRAGEIVLILGGGSGVGTAAIQIAKMLGARVIATAGDENKLFKSRDLGADYTINHYNEKISDEVRKITAKAGVDVVFEHVGQATWPKSVESLAPRGRLVTCGATTGGDARIDLRFLFSRHQSLLGSFMGTLGELHRVLKFVFQGQLKPVIDKVYPMSEIAAAHQRLENKEQFGKVVVVP